jgi:hyperosmotically inducible protein
MRFIKSSRMMGMAGLAGILMFGGMTQGLAQTAGGTVASGQINTQNDAQIQADVTKALNNKRYKDVKIAVQGGVVTLTGTVEVYAEKADAGNRAHHRKNVQSVDNLIEVNGPVVDDVTLRNKLSEKLVYDRVGYGTTAFNAFTIGVKDGVVTLGGVAFGPEDKDSAVGLVSSYPGVKDVVDNISVAPLSPMDNRIRLDEARAIYGAPQLNKYAIDPAKPIRITVQNGNVTLSGVVDNEGDKEVANVRANGVAGVFKVTNDLQVASAPEKEK